MNALQALEHFKSRFAEVAAGMVALRIALCKAKRGEGDLYTAQADWDFALQPYHVPTTPRWDVGTIKN